MNKGLSRKDGSPITLEQLTDKLKMNKKSHDKDGAGGGADNNAEGGKQMSDFAQSAYAHATHESTPPRHSFMGNLTNKFRGGKSGGHTPERMDWTYTDQVSNVGSAAVASRERGGYRSNNIVQAEFQPLAGTSIVLITGTSNQDKVGDSRSLQIMEERDNIGCTIQSLGASWVPALDSGVEAITHAIWIGADDGPETWKRIYNDALNNLSICQSMNIPVVNISWLIDINRLIPGQHWSEVDVEAHKPFVMNVLEKHNERVLGSKMPGSNQHRRSDSRRDSQSKLSASIGMTYNSLLKENPHTLEEDAIKRAMELSMLDFAVVHHVPNERHYTKVNEIQRNSVSEDPYKVLQIRPDASYEEIKKAYRQRALETHPDKGGSPGEFEAVARAYRIILNTSNKTGLDIIPSEDSADKDSTVFGLKSTSHWDSELKEHRNLVRELYTNHGHDVDTHIKRQAMVLEKLGLKAKDAGSQSINERNERINNSCFYLSISCSYLSGIGALEVWDREIDDHVKYNHDHDMLKEADATLIMDTALSLKRTIEAAVLAAHPEWAAQGEILMCILFLILLLSFFLLNISILNKGMVGEEVQAFSDFLVYTLESQTIVSDWAVVVFDTCSGFCDVYKGKGYNEQTSANESYAASNTITVQYLSGHYQPLLTFQPSRPSLKTILAALDEFGVLYVVTDGTAK